MDGLVKSLEEAVEELRQKILGFVSSPDFVYAELVSDALRSELKTGLKFSIWQSPNIANFMHVSTNL